jgi:hypothetical protein
MRNALKSMQEEAIFLEDEQPFNLFLGQLKMVFDSIMAELRIKYELRESQG